jgi:hypothetical protein
MRRSARTLVFVVALAIAGSATANSLFDLGQAIHSEPLGVNLAVMARLQRPLRILEGHSRNPETYTVAFMGDSTVIAYPEGQTVHERLRQAVTPTWPGPGRLWVESLSSVGMTPAGFFLVQDEINAAKPDIVIVTANLALILDPLPVSLKRPELAGWTGGARIYDALVAQDFYKFGVTADRLLLYKLFVTCGRTSEWNVHAQQQARLGHLRETVESAVAQKTGWTGEVSQRFQRMVRNRTDILLPGEPERYNQAGAKERMGHIMAGIGPDHWVMEVLRAVLENFADAGTAAVLYVPPLNVDHLQSVGAYDSDGLQRSIQTLEQIALDTGAEFADLHDLLPDAAFRDHAGHLTHAPPHDGPALVAEALASYVLAQARNVARTR